MTYGWALGRNHRDFRNSVPRVRDRVRGIWEDADQGSTHLHRYEMRWRRRGKPASTKTTAIPITSMSIRLIWSWGSRRRSSRSCKEARGRLIPRSTPLGLTPISDNQYNRLRETSRFCRFSAHCGAGRPGSPQIGLRCWTIPIGRAILVRPNLQRAPAGAPTHVLSVSGSVYRV